MTHTNPRPIRPLPPSLDVSPPLGTEAAEPIRGLVPAPVHLRRGHPEHFSADRREGQLEALLQQAWKPVQVSTARTPTCLWKHVHSPASGLAPRTTGMVQPLSPHRPEKQSPEQHSRFFVDMSLSAPAGERCVCLPPTPNHQGGGCTNHLESKKETKRTSETVTVGGMGQEKVESNSK